MRSQQDIIVEVPDFSLNRICDLQYMDMISKWFVALNPEGRLTPKLAFDIWAGIAFNMFFFTTPEEKVDMIKQV